MVLKETDVEVKKKDIYPAFPGITLMIYLPLLDKLKSLRTGIFFKKGENECMLKEGDSDLTAFIEQGQPTKITSPKCKECPFGGNNGQIVKDLTCNIYKRT